MRWRVVNKARVVRVVPFRQQWPVRFGKRQAETRTVNRKKKR